MRNCCLCGTEYDEQNPEVACEMWNMDHTMFISHVKTLNLTVHGKRTLNLCAKCVKAALFGARYLVSPYEAPDISIDFNTEEMFV